MDEAPSGLDFHKGIDGALVGFSIIFVVKVVGIISRFLKWSIIPNWSYTTVNDFEEWLSVVFDAIARTIKTHVSVSTPSIIQIPDTPLSGLFQPFIDLIGVPLHLFGFRDGIFVEQTLILFGFWIAIGSIVWFWIGKPLLFWWKESRKRIS